MPDLRRRDFLGLLAAVASCGLPVPTQSALPAPVVPTLPEPKKPKPAKTRSTPPLSAREDWVRACLGGAIAVDVSREVSVSGPPITRITYIKKEPGAAERCVFTKERARAEKGRIRLCEVIQHYPFEPLVWGEFDGTRRYKPTKTKPETRLVIEWIA